MIILTEALLDSTWEKPGHAAFKSLLCMVHLRVDYWSFEMQGFFT